MPDLQHPSDLNPIQRFRQANSLSKTTSRAKNPGWYQEALDLDFQLHIRNDGATISTFLYDRREDLWSFGPPLTEQALLNTEELTAYVDEAVKHVQAAGASALGVILYIADEFSLAEINPDFTDRDALPQLRESVINDPASVLADTSITAEQSSWRLLPYFAPSSETIATSVALSKRYDASLQAIRSKGEAMDFPIITHALSSPLVALLGIPGAVKRTPEKPAVAILQYPFFTALVFFNERSDLMLVRTQLHRGLRRPPNFGNAIATTNASLELMDPDIFVFPLGRDVDPTLASDLATAFPNHHVQLVNSPTGSLPPWCAECVIATKLPEEGENAPASFHLLREERWAFQDFLPPSKATSEIYPSKAEMKLLRGLRMARFAAIIVGLLAVGWLVFGMFQIVRSPEWAFDPAETKNIKKRLVMLNMEKQKTEHWDSLLADRSKAWSSMESLVRLFPEKSGILVKSYVATTRPDSSPGQAKVGLVKEWKITGMVKDNVGLELLNTLNTREGISAHFNEIARITGNSAFRTDIGTRSVVVNFRTQENSSFRRGAPNSDAVVQSGLDEGSYPYTFDLAITQRFEATDPLALIVAKAP